MRTLPHSDSDELETAAAKCKASLTRDPNDVAAISELASIRVRQGFIESGLAGFELAVRLRPDLPALHFNRGNAFQTARRFDEAAAAYRRAVELQPNFPEAFQNLGNTLAEAGKRGEAVEAYLTSLRLRPDTIAVLNNLATTLLGLGRNVEAVAALRRAVSIQPNIPELHNNLGNGLRELEQWEAAEQAYRYALSLSINHPESLVNLGSLLVLQRRSDEAIELLTRAGELLPRHGQVLSDLAHQLQSTARWERLPKVCRILTEIVESSAESGSLSPHEQVSPQTFLSLAVATSRAQQLKCARRWSRGRSAPSVATPTPATKINRDGTKLRIGYVSADFHAHPVGFVMLELIEAHNRQAFEVFGYGLGSPKTDTQAAKLVQAFDRFRVLDATTSHQQAAEIIRNDEIDILVDLQGYSPGCRSEILALQPAPIRVSYLGFPGTMGADFIDYLVADRYVVPEEHRSDYHEQIVYLPGCFMPGDSRVDVQNATPDRGALGLPEEAFVFCAFSMPFKTTPSMFACWMNILRSVPNSVLWLRDWDAGASMRLRQQAASMGVDPSRLIFAPLVELSLHWARHRAADLYLDTFPYNQHSTAGDALRTGVPLLTLSGETFASRVAGSFLQALGLPELIAQDLGDYERKAIQLATSSTMLGELRARLCERLRFTDVFSGVATARKLERAFVAMWERHRQGLPPCKIEIEPDKKAEQEIELQRIQRGNRLLQAGRYAEAEAVYRQVILDHPHSVAAHNNLGASLREAGRLEEAIDCFHEALRLQPNFIDGLLNLGTTYLDLDRSREALDAFRTASPLQPDNLETLGYIVHLKQKLCEWTELDAINQRIIEHLDADDFDNRGTLIPPFAALVLHEPTTAAQQLRCAQAWTDGPNGVLRSFVDSNAAALRRDAQAAGFLEPTSETDYLEAGAFSEVDPAARAARLQREKRLRIGYLSADYRYHPTAFLISELFEVHDRSAVEVFAYSYGPNDRSRDRTRIEAGVDSFVDIAELSFADAAQRIRHDAIDILVDLKGMTQFARTEILGYRPAPIQVNYLGYPSTMGSVFVDYIIVDDFVVPPSQQTFFRERLVSIPGCYQVNESWTPIAQATTARPDFGLPDDAFVFCDFNNSFKISERMFAVWMSLLREVGGSVLWLMDSHPEVVVNLRRQAERFGVAAERLIFAPSVSRDQHLSRMSHADLFLDTFPYSAHTTGSDALRAGLPLLTLVGETFASRVAGSLLNTLGLHELIAETPQQYHDRALQLAHRPSELRSLRYRLQAQCRSSDLFDAQAFARKIEAAYAAMWEDYRIKPIRPGFGR